MTASSRSPNRARNQAPDFVLFCRMSGILQDFYGKPLIGRLAGRWPPA
jgi:hypothetical protein